MVSGKKSGSIVGQTTPLRLDAANGKDTLNFVVNLI